MDVDGLNLKDLCLLLQTNAATIDFLQSQNLISGYKICSCGNEMLFHTHPIPDGFILGVSQLQV